MTSEKEIAIYYPYIDPTDAVLIKTTALYWDELQTIVPESVRSPYQSPIAKEANEAGFLKPRIVHPRDDSVIKTGDEFCADIEHKEVRQRVVTGIRKLKRKRFSRIHFEKLAEESLFRVWEAIREDIPLSTDTDGYVVFPEPLGHSYMSRLASVIAQHDKSIPLTNLPAFQDILNDRFIDYSDEQRHNQSQLATMSLKTIFIVSETPLIGILRFRDKHRDMLLNFRRQLRELSRQVAIGLNTAERERVLEEIIKDKVLPVRGEIETKLSEGDIAFGLSAMNIVQATLMGALASGGQSWITGIAGAGISLSISLVQSLREDRNIIKEEPFGYLYQAQEEFGQNQ